MAKSKNHTNHNQSYKNHRNGIKQVPKTKYGHSRGISQTLLRNNRRARKFDPNVKKQKNLASKIETMRQNKDKLQQLIVARKAKQIAKRMQKTEKKPVKAKKPKKK